MICRDSSLLPGHNLCFMNGDTGVPDTADAMRRMTEMKDSGVDAFVGLEHSCVSEAFLAAAWETPVISYVSFFLTILYSFDLAEACSFVLSLMLPPSRIERSREERRKALPLSLSSPYNNLTCRCVV